MLKRLLKQPIPRFSADWLRLRLGLLQGKEEICGLCGKPGRRPGSSTITPMPVAGLCPSCTAAVPWIRDIRCPVCGRSVDCGDCLRRSDTYFSCNRSAVRYDETMKALLAKYKYRGSEALEATLGDMLLPAYRHLTQETASRINMNVRSPTHSERRMLRTSRMLWTAVTYVPISAERAEERGFNQAERLARQVGARYGLPVIPLLRRTRHSGKMSFKTRAERFRDMRTLFAPAPEGFDLLRALCKSRPPDQPSAPARLLLVDDIYTTGSTLNACARILRSEPGLETLVYGLTWARS